MRKSKRGFSFVPEVKVSHLIDSPIVFFARISFAREWMNNQECFKLASRCSVLFFLLFCHFLSMGKFKTAHLTVDPTANVARKSKREKTARELNGCW